MVIQDIEQVEPSQVLEKGYLLQGRLPSGCMLTIVPLLFGRALLGMSLRPPLENVGVYETVWEFPEPLSAIIAFLSWNPEEQKEPQGWDRHPDTMRYRINGDPELEYVKIDTNKPLTEEIKRAAQVCSGYTLVTASIEETRSAYAKDGPEGTSSFVVSWSHDFQGKPCQHMDCALVYLDRCIILTIEDMIQLIKDPRSPATIWQRLMPGGLLEQRKRDEK